MAYVPKPETTNWEAPPGVAPWRELSDEEFDQLEQQHGPGLARWFDHVSDVKATMTKKGAARVAAEGDD